jgi:RNA polymerase sigma factor (sigma-70 family)
MSEIVTDSDRQLLTHYHRDHAEDAFAEIVRRHLGLVHTAALRQVRSPQLAEEVAQSVFADLARSVNQLKPDTILTAWLYQVTRRTAIDVVRREARRQLREQIATELNAMNATPTDWANIEPLLDDAMAALDETDRTAVLLRYFENKTLREVGATLGTSDDTAQKRVSRAVERLREFFAKRGITVGASGLVVVISANAVQAAPVGLAVTISTAAALAGTTIATTAAATAIKTIAMTTLQKTLITATLAAAIGTGIYEAHQAAHWREQNQTLQKEHTEQIQQLQQERDNATNRLALLANETASLQNGTLELLKLRGEVGTLRQRTNDLGKILQAGSGAAGRSLTADNTSQDSPGPANFPRDSWAFEGFATPEAAMKSFMWAKSTGDIKTVLASGTSELRQEVEAAYFKDKSEEERKAILLENVKNVTGVEILKKMALSDDQVILQAHFGGSPDKTYSILTMIKMDGEWKVSSVEERTDDH